MKSIRNQRGMALFTALLMSLVIMAMVTGVLYFVTQSTKMTGAGKRYATADEAATGAVEVMKDSINQVVRNGSISDLLNDENGCIIDTIFVGGVCAMSMALPTEIGGFFSATVTLERLFSQIPAGARLEFARSAGGPGGIATFYRINTKVVGPGNSTAENSVLYRFVE